MKPQTLFITGTDTGVGKTVLADLLTRHLRAAQISVAALKPVCSGDREDARALHSALGGALTLDEINPWHFRAAISPLLAARAEKRRVNLAAVVVYARRFQKQFPVLIVEGAGGLLSPLGENFDSRDLIKALRATPVVVAPNRLGIINQLLLTLEALPPATAWRTQIVLMQLPKSDAASPGNQKFLMEKLGRNRVHVLPWMPSNSATPERHLRPTLAALVRSLKF